MSTKNRILGNLGLTLCLFGLVTLKITIIQKYYVDGGSVLRSFLDDPLDILFLFYYGVFLSALFSLITVWLPNKAQTLFGILTLYVFGAVGLLEFGCKAFVIIVCLILGKSIPIFTVFEFLITLGVLAVTGYVVLTSDEYDDYKSKKKEQNKSQWIFFSPKKVDFSNGNERCYRRREIGGQKPTREDNGINIEKLGKRLFAAAVAAIVVSASCLIFISSDTAVWRISFVCMLIGGLGLFVGVALLIFDHIRK